MTGIFKTNRLLLFVLGICLLGSCQTKQTNVYNILDYGATGDGTTDDAQALQRAIDACSKARGGTVLVPAGQPSCAAPSGSPRMSTCILNPIRACWRTLTRAPTPKAHSAKTGAKG